MSTKVIIAGVMAGITSFLAGWLIWGMLLAKVTEGYSNMACMRGMDDMNLPMIFVGQLIFGFFYAYIFSKWATITTFAAGATAGALLSGLMGLGFDLMMYATTTMMNSLNVIAVDMAGNIVIGVIVGGLIGWWYGRDGGSRGAVKPN